MQHQDLEGKIWNDLIEESFRFMSWLKNNFPSRKNEYLPSYYSSFGEFIREIPTGIWEEVGSQDHQKIVEKSTLGESIFDRVVSTVKRVPPDVGNQILIGFVEAHMFPRPDSPLGKELGEALDMDLSGLC